MAAKTVKGYLIYSAHNDSLRVNKKLQALAWDEVAFEVKVKVPDSWGRMAGAILIDLPDEGPAVIEVKVDEPVLPKEGTDAPE